MIRWSHTPHPYPSLDGLRYDAVVDGRYVKSSFSSGNGGCLSFTVTDGLIGFQDDLNSPQPSARPAPSSSPSRRWPPSSLAPRTETSTTSSAKPPPRTRRWMNHLHE